MVIDNKIISSIDVSIYSSWSSQFQLCHSRPFRKLSLRSLLIKVSDRTLARLVDQVLVGGRFCEHIRL